MSMTEYQTSLEVLKVELKKYSKGRFSRFLRSPIKTVIAILMRRLGVSSNKRLPLFWGADFYGVLPEAISSIIWRFGYFDPSTSINLINGLEEGAVFVDVGAHFGYFSLLASSVVKDSGRVIAVEAMPSTFERLENNIRKNQLGNICETINCAAFDRETTVEFKDYGLALSSLNSAFGIRNENIKTREGVSNVIVSAQTLDFILEDKSLDRVDVVKIDAESSEYFVLLGMASTLERFHPLLIIELGDEGTADSGKTTMEIIDYLEDFGYVAYQLVNNVLVPIDKLESYTYCNLVFK